jgi:hypothetical protein
MQHWGEYNLFIAFAGMRLALSLRIIKCFFNGSSVCEFY